MAVTSSRRDVLHFSYGTAAALDISALASGGVLGITPVRASIDDDLWELFEQYSQQVVAMAWRSVRIKAPVCAHTLSPPRTR